VPTPMFLRSPSTLSSHLVAGHPTLLLPCNVVMLTFYMDDFHLS
jgi:hypothetical protein